MEEGDERGEGVWSERGTKDRKGSTSCHEEEDTCMSYEGEDTCMSYEEDTCLTSQKEIGSYEYQ